MKYILIKISMLHDDQQCFCDLWTIWSMCLYIWKQVHTYFLKFYILVTGFCLVSNIENATDNILNGNSSPAQLSELCPLVQQEAVL